MALGTDFRQDDDGDWARTQRDEIGLLAEPFTVAARWCAPDRHYPGRGAAAYLRAAALDDALIAVAA